MSNKIKKTTLEHIKLLCYEVALNGIIDRETRSSIKLVVENYLNNNRYVVKCDEENNPPDVVDKNQVKIWISEQVISGSVEEFKYEIIL